MAKFWSKFSQKTRKIENSTDFERIFLNLKTKTRKILDFWNRNPKEAIKLKTEEIQTRSSSKFLRLENSKGNTRFLLKMMREGLSFQAEFQLSFGDFWSFETVSITKFLSWNGFKKHSIINDVRRLQEIFMGWLWKVEILVCKAQFLHKVTQHKFLQKLIWWEWLQ